jgi:hypothetical protein
MVLALEVDRPRTPDRTCRAVTRSAVTRYTQLSGALELSRFPLEVLAGPVYSGRVARASGRDYFAHCVLTFAGPAGRFGLRW